MIMGEVLLEIWLMCVGGWVKVISFQESPRWLSDNLFPNIHLTANLLWFELSGSPWVCSGERAVLGSLWV